VLVDNIGGTVLAVRHLAAHGHNRIAFLGDAPDIFTANERLRGFREGCVRAGIRYDEDLVAMGPHDERASPRCCAGSASHRQPATAVVTGNNRTPCTCYACWPADPTAPPWSASTTSSWPT